MKKKKIFIISSIILVVLLAIIIFNTLNNKEPNIKTYKVTFMGVNDEIKEQIVTEGKIIQIPEEPTKDGYIFIGWFNEDNIFDFSKPIKENITLVAKWKELKVEIETFVVKFDSVGGTTISNQVIEKGNKIQKPNNPAKQGYTFKGWMINDKEYDFNKEVVENLTLIAKWEKVENKTNKPVNNGSTNNDSTNNSTNSEVNNNNNNKIIIPTLAKAYDKHIGFENGKYLYDLVIKNTSDYYCKLSSSSFDCSVDGYEVYEKKGSQYILIGSVEMGGAVVAEVEAGTKKTLVARVYQYNSSNQKVYSGYSKELVLDNSNN